MSFELHPLCSLFPRVTGAEFDALVADIKANGLRQPIVLHDGMVLDGGNRYRACLEAGVEPRFAEFDGGNMVSFVRSANLHRRHLTPGQQAAIVASMQDWAKAQTHGGDRRGAQAATLPLDTVAERAAESGASERTQRMADKVAKADPALAKKVAHGEVSLPQAVAKVDGKAKRAKAAKPKAAVQEAVEPSDPELGQDPADLLNEFKRDLERAEGRVRDLEALLAADDTRKALLDMNRRLEHAERRRDEAMQDAAKLKSRCDLFERQLARCGKAVGERDQDRIVCAVEAMARAARKVAA